MAQGPWYANFLDRISQGLRDPLPRTGRGSLFALAHAGCEWYQPAKFAVWSANAEGPAGPRAVLCL